MSKNKNCESERERAAIAEINKLIKKPLKLKEFVPYATAFYSKKAKTVLLLHKKTKNP